MDKAYDQWQLSQTLSYLLLMRLYLLLLVCILRCTVRAALQEHTKPGYAYLSLSITSSRIRMIYVRAFVLIVFVIGVSVRIVLTGNHMFELWKIVIETILQSVVISSCFACILFVFTTVCLAFVFCRKLIFPRCVVWNGILVRCRCGYLFLSLMYFP